MDAVTDVSVYSGGAAQWRHPCEDCGNPDTGLRRMHSEVSRYNHEYFIDEDRVAEHVTADQLLAMLDRADGALIVCNNCNTIREVDG